MPFFECAACPVAGKNYYDITMKHWLKVRDEVRAADWFGSKAAQRYLFSNFDKSHDGKIDTCD